MKRMKLRVKVRAIYLTTDLLVALEKIKAVKSIACDVKHQFPFDFH